MPIYEYNCEQCQHCFEKLVFAGDEPNIECPRCGKKKVKKLMSSSSFIAEGIGRVCTSGTPGGFS